MKISTLTLETNQVYLVLRDNKIVFFFYKNYTYFSMRLYLYQPPCQRVHTKHGNLYVISLFSLQFADKMIRARDSIDARAQDFVTNDELLLPILKAFSKRTFINTLLEMLDVFSACSSITLCHTNQYQSSSIPYSQRPPHRARHTRCGYNILVCRLYLTS